MCNCKALLKIFGAVLAIVIAYGITLSRTPPPPINPTAIIEDGGKYITTADGRFVEYFVYGSSQTDATVIIEVAGGIMTGRFIPKYVEGLQEYCIQHNIKGISITLPGWGYSSLHPKRKYVDWPRTDLSPILDAEDVDKFAISGVSLGSPHSMAAAYYYGAKGRVTAIGVRVPFLGLPLSKEEDLPIGQASIATHIVCDKTWWYSWLIHLLFHIFNKMISTPWILRYALPHKFNEEYPKLTQSALDDIVRAQKHSSYHGLMQCLAYDTIIEWDFDIRHLKGVKKIVVWYANDDDDCPPSHGRWIAKYFNTKQDVQVKVRQFDGYGHLGAAILDHIEYTKLLLSS